MPHADPGSDVGIVLTTAPDEGEAFALARALVERRLAACVNVVPGVRSVYRWQGTVHEDDERLLVVKIRRSRFDEVRETIRALHSYDTPEIVLIPIQDGDPAYLAWLADATARERGSQGP